MAIDTTKPVDLKIISAGANWVRIGEIISLGMTGYYNRLPEGSTSAVHSMHPGVAQVQLPDAQLWPVAHAEQPLVPAAHDLRNELPQAQEPFRHVWPAAHTVPQAPQLFVSVWRFVQALPQQVAPFSQGLPLVPLVPQS